MMMSNTTILNKEIFPNKEMLYLNAVIYREFCCDAEKKPPQKIPENKPHLQETFVTITSSFYYWKRYWKSLTF